MYDDGNGGDDGEGGNDSDDVCRILVMMVIMGMEVLIVMAVMVGMLVFLVMMMVGMAGMVVVKKVLTVIHAKVVCIVRIPGKDTIYVPCRKVHKVITPKRLTLLNLHLPCKVGFKVVLLK